MRNFNKKNGNTLSRSLIDLDNHNRNSIKKFENALTSLSNINSFLDKVDKRRRITFSDIEASFEDFVNLFNALNGFGLGDETSFMKGLIAGVIKDLVNSIDLKNPNTINMDNLKIDKPQNGVPIVKVSKVDLLKKHGDCIYILDGDKLNNYCVLLRGFINFKKDFEKKWEKSLEKAKELQITVSDVIKCEKKRDIISDDMKNYLIERLDDNYADWKNSWDFGNLIDIYNDSIKEQRRNKEKAIANRNLNFEIEDKPVLENGYKIRIDELMNYYDIKEVNNLIPNITMEQLNYIQKYTLDTDLKISSTNIIELDSLLFVNSDLLQKSLSEYKEAKAKLYINLLIRTYVIKKMPSELEYLLSIIQDVEVAIFDPRSYLSGANRKNEADLVISYQQYIGTLKATKNPALSIIEERFDSLKLLVYMLSTGDYSEKEYLEEFGPYVSFLEEHMNDTIGTIDEEITEISPAKTNTVYLLTDEDNISFVEKDILTDVSGVSKQANAFDKVMRLESIDVHNDIDVCKYKTDSYSEDLLKKLNFKSGNFKGSRVYFGYFANDKREPLVIVYGIKTGSMDSTSQRRYFKEVTNNLKPNIDKIMDVVNAFKTDRNKFDKYLAESETAKDHFKEVLKANGYKKENVNTLEME